jgi:hypothetical protein
MPTIMTVTPACVNPSPVANVRQPGDPSLVMALGSVNPSSR